MTRRMFGKAALISAILLLAKSPLTPKAEGSALPPNDPTNEMTPLEKEIYNLELFKRCAPNAKKSMIDKVMTEINGFDSQPGFGKKLQAAVRWEGEINSVANVLGLPIDSFDRKLLQALMVVESGGNKNAVSLTDNGSVIAIGLCQMRQEAAEDRLKNLIQTNPELVDYFHLSSPVNLDDPTINILMSFEHLKHLNYVYLDPALALWAYHLGEGNMNSALRVYLENDLKISPSEVDSAFFQFNPPGTREYILSKNITYPDLVNSPAVIAHLKQTLSDRTNPVDLGDNFGDATLHYVPRITAAYEYLKYFTS